jgi:hypothetical protein
MEVNFVCVPKLKIRNKLPPLVKEVATNTHPRGWEITIQIYHLGFHIDFSSIEKTRARAHLLFGVYPKTGYRLFPPITLLHFFGLRPFASRYKQSLRKVRSPIPWIYGVFYIVYYWMILTAIL